VGFKHLLLVTGAATALSCGTGGPKVQPSPVPVIEDPVVSCPSDIAVTTHNGAIPTITFDVPTADKGAPPVAVVCTPASGTEFGNGATTVTCEATDSRARKGSCTFLVTVTPTPRLVKTTFLAFGDSLTEGKPATRVQSEIAIPQREPPVLNTDISYVTQLDAKFRARYQDQTITIYADGFGGRSADDDKERERQALIDVNPDALLLLEGTNNLLDDPSSANIRSAGDALQKMVQNAKARGVRVFLATLPRVNSHAPGYQNNAGAEAAVPLLNSRIVGIAAAENVRLVDMFSAVPLTEIGVDGVHLTVGGYGIMADEWLKAIIDTMEVKPE
jgi:lysophospholipase L1-like esterase